MAQKSKTDPPHSDMPPRPKGDQIKKTNKNTYDLKRWRHDDAGDEKIILSPTKSILSPPKNVNQVFNYVPIDKVTYNNVIDTDPTNINETKNNLAPPHISQPNQNNPNQSTNYKNATSHTSTFQTHENNSNSNNELILEELGDDTMIGQATTETIQVNLTANEGHHEASNDCKEDMVT